jgi:nitrogen PTS system EIIA component
MNVLGRLLQVEDISLDVESSTKAQLLGEVARLLASRHALSEAQVLDCLLARERLGSTGIGHGIAIPHARTDVVLEAAGAFVRTLRPVPFDSPDGKPVSCVLALLVPRKATERHLELMGAAAEVFADSDFREGLRSCTMPECVARLFAQWQRPA